MAAALTAAAVLTLASQYGWDANKAAWIAGKESTNRPDVVSANGKWVGLYQVDWQLHGLDKEALKDPAYNTAVAFELYQQAGWSPWPVASSYPGGAIVGVSADGWLDWAERLPGNPANVNGGVNAVKGVFLHSAEGYASVLLDPNSQYGYHGSLSWHLTNLMDGRVFQHFPLTAQCWHATAANDAYVGMEHEGLHTKEASLNQVQIDNAKRVIADISAWKGWAPTRPISAADTSNTLWEHREVIKLGGTGTECPDGRIPWDKILEVSMKDGWIKEGHSWALYNEGACVWRVGTVDGTGTIGQTAKLMGDGNYYNLAHLASTDGHNAPAVFSNQITD